MEQGRRRRLLYLRNRSSYHHSSHRSPAALQGQGHRDDPPAEPCVVPTPRGIRQWAALDLQSSTAVHARWYVREVGGCWRGAWGNGGGSCRGMRTFKFEGGEVAESEREEATGDGALFKGVHWVKDGYGDPGGRLRSGSGGGERYEYRHSTHRLVYPSQGFDT